MTFPQWLESATLEQVEELYKELVKSGRPSLNDFIADIRRLIDHWKTLE